MNGILSFDRIERCHQHLVGGKALTLATQMRSGIMVPNGLCVTTSVYEDFIRTTNLSTRIGLELGRLPLAEMRWEEIWDLALRIRSFFLNTSIPDTLKEMLSPELEQHFAGRAVAVRSSSPQEDRFGTSFAGLHESYINVRGLDAILEHIRLVWSSLWSDGALLYRKELGMTMEKSAMAVIIQELVVGERSGVTFSMSPDGADHVVVESVYGLNQGLVDGSITPDRWTLDRQTGKVIHHLPAVREQAMRLSAGGTQLMPLTNHEKKAPPLSFKMLDKVYRMAMTLEQTFDHPQDMEWTIKETSLFLLQSRPVTTHRTEPTDGNPWSATDKRPWYLSLKRSFDNLKTLHRRIEDELLPQMATEAETLSKTDLARLCDAELIEAIETRILVHQHWVDVYWHDLIPFAHGARLFGQVYNDLVKPDDPYAFTALLGETRMTGIERNRDLQILANRIRTNDCLREKLASGLTDDLNIDFSNRLEAFLNRYGDLTFKAKRFFKDRKGLIRLLLEMATQTELKIRTGKQDIASLTTDFFARFPEERQDFAREILEIGRSSYRLRDNDNIVLARIEAQLLKAVDEARRRISILDRVDVDALSPTQVVKILSNPSNIPEILQAQETIDEPIQHQGKPGLAPEAVITSEGNFVMRARQIIGQPAGQGLAVGTARVISAVEDLFRFKYGEILVCDSIDPNMTFVVPLAAAIVERRGGMLVHGAIIAREYGLPCVTGVADATVLIHTGDRITVDGYLGIVTIDI